MLRIRPLALAASFAMAGCGSTLVDRTNPVDRTRPGYLIAVVVLAPLWVPMLAVAHARNNARKPPAGSEPKPEPSPTGSGADRP